ncbi:MAG: putative hydro-lyase [Hyphomicrobiales bacterium]
MPNNTSSDYSTLRSMNVDDVRQSIRSGAYTGHTAGLAPGKLQANLAILPENYALDFMRFCQRNPKPCPLVGVSETGDPIMRTLGKDIDIRTDVPGYNVYRNGVLDTSTDDISDLWSDDLVVFALGCSFTFERALMEAGLPLWHIDHNKTVPMYRTSLATKNAGVFGGGTVVSMRGIPTDRIQQATEISRKYPWAHGAPVHCGDPADIGIADLSKPDWGDEAPILPGETQVFWACGVTPQNAIREAKIPFSITHIPGRMLITDVDEFAEVPIL